MRDDHCVLSLRPLPVVQPPGRILSIGLEVLEGKVVSGSQLSSPPRSHGIQDEVTGVKIIMGLMSDVLATLHGDKEGIAVGPAAPHRRPLVCIIQEEAVERKATPPGTSDSGIIPKHTPRLSRIALIALVEKVLGDLELGAVEDDRVGGGGEFVGTVVTVVEQGGGSVRVHVEEAGIPEFGVLVQHTIVGTGRGQEGRSHLGVAGGTKVPVVGGLGPSTIRGDTVHAVVQSVGDGLAKEVLGGSGGIITKDSKGTKGKATIANTVPVTRGIGLPPSKGDGRSIKDGLARCQTVEDHVVPHLLLLVIAQNIIKPIVSDGIGGNHLSGIQKVPVVPLVCRRTEVARGRVLQSGSATEFLRKTQVVIPRFHPRPDQPTWCSLSSCRHRRKP